MTTSGCNSGAFSLESGNSFSGVLHYCYDGSTTGQELLPVCGMTWNQIHTEMVCRDILGTSESGT